MNAKKHRLDDPPGGSRPGQADQTRKVEGMSELVAGLLLDDPDATSPPPDASPGNFSAVRSTGRPFSERPRSVATVDEPTASRRPRIGWAIMVAVLIALTATAIFAAVMVFTT